MGTYKQFCPVAKAMELLDERWTLLIIRELIAGSTHFNELRRGVPRMSPALLSKRLQRLVRAGIVERHDDGNRVRYALSPAGRELEPVVETLGTWGIRWIGELGDEDLDPQLLVWDMHRNIDLAAVPRGRTVVRLSFTDVAHGSRSWWLVITPESVDVCDSDPGHPIDLGVHCGLRTLVRIWRGDIDWSTALCEELLEVVGSPHLARAFPRWLRLSMFASVPRASAPLG
ncbi:winged helix-turn-helix transcriptional regulator [Salinactinospora qingdaonensis]|uniref:Helix-turn-helix domain-containing protein n=1 Tax=Salinactinospora qingdaonensis TaxID=702744 RepID=A0ABP7EWG5_9ACTN